jgi:hypothetical protein
MILYNAIGGAGDLRRYIEWQDRTRRVKPFNVLFSFPFITGSYNIIRNLRQAGRIANLFLDAGTFTLNEGKRGKGPRPLTRFSEYVHFVAMYHDVFDRIAAYDEDFDHVSINEELLTALHRRLLLSGTSRPAMSEEQIKEKIVPTLHSGDAGVVDELKRYIDDGYKCVAIGSRPKITDETWSKLKEFAYDNGPVTIHHFGSLSPKFLNERKPDSADSTGFLKAGAHGGVTWWKPRSISIDGFQRYDLSANSSELAGDGEVTQKHVSQEYQSYIAKYFQWGINDLRDDSSKRAAVNLHAITRLEDWLNNKPDNESL